MIDLAAEIADCESVGVECALALALNFPRVYNTVPTQKSIIAAQPKRVMVRCIETSARTWVKVQSITCPHRINVKLRRRINAKLSTSQIVSIPLSAVFAFA